MTAKVDAPTDAVAGGPWLPYVAVTVTMLLFASSIVLGRAIRADIPPLGLVFWRNVAAFLVLLPFLWRDLRGEQGALLKKEWRLVLILGFANSVTGQAILLFGLHTTTAINAGLIHAIGPAVTIALVWVLFRDRITLRQSAGLAAAFIGVAALVVRGDVDVLASVRFVAGDFWVLVATASYAAYGAFLKRVPAALNPVVLFLGATVTGFVMIAPFYAAETLLTETRVRIDLVTIATVLYYAVFPSILALSFLIFAIKRLGPNRASAFYYLVPVMTAVMAIVLLGEALEPYHVFGTVLVLGGVYLASAAAGVRSGPP